MSGPGATPLDPAGPELSIPELVDGLASALGAARDRARAAADEERSRFEVAEASMEVRFASADGTSAGRPAAEMRIRIDAEYLAKVRPEAIGVLKIRLVPSPVRVDAGAAVG